MSYPQYCSADDMEKHILREEIARLTKALHFEQHWLSHIGTHGPGCYKWGPNHYECAISEIERLKLIQAKVLKAIESGESFDRIDNVYAPMLRGDKDE